jgi:hypothetical protein
MSRIELDCVKSKYDTDVDVSKITMKLVDTSIELDYKESILKPYKIVGRGAYGEVILCRDETETINVALKISKDNNEYKMVQELSKLGDVCGIAGMRHIYRNGSDNFYVMNVYDGDLKFWLYHNINKLTLLNRIEILISILSQYECLTKYGLCYTDIKLENVFYRCVASQLVIHVGDIGGITVCSTKKGTFTYKSIFSDLREIKTPQTIDETMIWGSVVLLYILLNPDIKLLFAFERYTDRKYKSIDEFMDIVEHHFKSIDYTPSDRIIVKKLVKFCSLTIDILATGPITFVEWFNLLMNELKLIYHSE